MLSADLLLAAQAAASCRMMMMAQMAVASCCRMMMMALMVAASCCRMMMMALMEVGTGQLLAEAPCHADCILALMHLSQLP